MKQSIKFTALTLFFSILFSGLGLAFSWEGGILTLLYSLGASAAVLAIDGIREFKPKPPKPLWLLASILLPLIYLLLPSLVAYEELALKGFTQILVISMIVSLVGSFLEEVAWRGYLMKELKKIGWIKMNLCIGVIWSIWHFPAIFTNSYPISDPFYFGVLIFMINVILLSFIFAWMKEKTGSLIIPIVLHASHNITFKVFNSESLVSESSLMLTASLLLLIVILKMWKTPAAQK